MNDLIAIWGKNGTGKSTVASNLACWLAKNGHTTAIIGANPLFGSIQHFFNADIPAERSIRHLLAGQESMGMSQYFNECPAVKRLSIASLANSDDCLGYRPEKPDSVIRFLGIAKRSYRYTICDCDESPEDPLSMHCLAESSRIAYVTSLTVQGFAFSKACESLVQGLRIADRMEIVVNAPDARAGVGLSGCRLFGIERKATVLPFCKDVRHAACAGKPFALTNCAGRQASRYRAALEALAQKLSRADGGWQCQTAEGRHGYAREPDCSGD